MKISDKFTYASTIYMVIHKQSSRIYGKDSVTILSFISEEQNCTNEPDEKRSKNSKKKKKK